MSVSTDGQLCYGVLFEEGQEFPWGSDEWDGDIEVWWLYDVCGYRNPFELFDSQGNWLNGMEAQNEKVEEYYSTRFAFEKKHPVPVELVNYCSGDFPMYIVAVPGSVVARRGFPEMISVQSLMITSEKQIALWEFCRDHLGVTAETVDTEPRWWLSSYWG